MTLVDDGQGVGGQFGVDRNRPPVGGGIWGRRALGVIAVLPIGSYLWLAVSRLTYPFDLEWLEGGSVELVRRVSAGQSLYVSPTLDFTPWPYPPLYFWVSAGVARLTGEGYLPLRLVSLISSVVALVLIAMIVRHVGRSWLGGLIGAGLFAATFQLSGAWLDIGRVDSLFLALLLGAVLAGLRSKTWRGGVLMGALLFLAFLTKQNALIAAVPIVAWLVVYRRAAGVAAAVTLGVTSVGSVVLGNAMTDGWYGEYVIRELLGQPVELRWTWGFWVIDLAVPLLLTLLVLVAWGRVRARSPEPLAARLVSPHGYLAAVTIGLVAASWAGRLHSGGYANVVIPAYAALAMLFGVAVSELLEETELTEHAEEAAATRWLSSGRLAAVFGVQVVLLLLIPWRGVLPWDQVPTAADRAAGDRLVALVGALPGGVVIPVHPYLLTAGGRPAQAQSLAVGDVLRGRDGRARQALEEARATALDGVSVVILDTPGEAAPFEPVLSEEFTALPPDTLEQLIYRGNPDVLRPVTDLAIRPTYVYVRTTDLAEVEAVLAP